MSRPGGEAAHLNSRRAAAAALVAVAILALADSASFRFTGRVKGTKLKPGRYVMEAVARG